MEVQKWDAPEKVVENWQDIGLNAYKFIFERSVIKHDEIISESEAITKRSIQLLTAFFSIIILVVGSTYKQQPNCMIIGAIGAIVIVDLVLFYLIFFGLGLVLKGSEPQLMLREKLLTYKEDNVQLKRLYYEEIVRLQRSILTNKLAVNKRRENYYGAIVFCLILFALSAIVICNYVTTIFHP